jgi:hypothetical protein
LFDYNIAHLAELISQRRYAFDNLLNFFRLVVVDLLYRVLLELTCLIVKIIGPSIHIRCKNYPLAFASDLGSKKSKFVELSSSRLSML